MKWTFPYHQAKVAYVCRIGVRLQGYKDCRTQNGSGIAFAYGLLDYRCNDFISRHPMQAVNTLRPRQDRRHFADDIFTCIFFNENGCILIKFSLKHVRKGSNDNNPALVQIMAWRRLSEQMMIILQTHICVTRPQWVKNSCYSGEKQRVPLRSVVPEAGTCINSGEK